MTAYDVGDRIRMMRRSHDLSQDELAELASLNRVTVAKYESGKVEPGAKALSRLADALETSVDALLGREADDQVEEDEVMQIRELLRRDSSYRMLFSAAKTAQPDHIRAAAAMLKALERDDDN